LHIEVAKWCFIFASPDLPGTNTKYQFSKFIRKGDLNMRKKKRLIFNVGVLLDPETYQRLVMITKEKRIPKSRFCRELLQEKLSLTLEVPKK
jgi:hypothetical protein